MAVVAFIEMGRNDLTPLGHGALSQLPKITISPPHKQQMRILLHFRSQEGRIYLLFPRLWVFLVYEASVSNLP